MLTMFSKVEALVESGEARTDQNAHSITISARMYKFFSHHARGTMLYS
jgi:hypothetical protein